MKQVKMKFNFNGYYNDPMTPLYYAGKVYIIDENMVQRWIKRGAEVLPDQDETIVAEPSKEGKNNPEWGKKKPVEVVEEGPLKSAPAPEKEEVVEEKKEETKVEVKEEVKTETLKQTPQRVRGVRK